MVCTEPHIIVWAKKMGFAYWPAKMISIVGQLINVRFFGDHTSVTVPAVDCFLYSNTPPNRCRNTTSSYKSALRVRRFSGTFSWKQSWYWATHFLFCLQEADFYILSIREKFGSYHLAKTKTVLNLAALDKQIVQVIPELAGSQWVESIEACLRINSVNTSPARNEPTIIASDDEQSAASANNNALDWDFIDKLLVETRNDLANGWSAESAMQQTVSEVEYFSVDVSFTNSEKNDPFAISFLKFDSSVWSEFGLFFNDNFLTFFTLLIKFQIIQSRCHSIFSKRINLAQITFATIQFPLR